jgi:hypothetical protein
LITRFTGGGLLSHPIGFATGLWQLLWLGLSCHAGYRHHPKLILTSNLFK